MANPGHTLPEPWDGIAVQHCAAVHALYSGDYAGAYSHQKQVCQLFFRWFQDASAWALPILYLLLTDLREFASLADGPGYAAGGGLPSLEECTRLVSKAFSLCATDRTNKGRDSRRNGAYHTACLSIKCYFRVGKPNLCKNVVRAVTSDPKTPPVSAAPLGDQITWHFYIGMLAFLAGEDAKATSELEWALAHCPASAHRNLELILTYLIPLHLLRGSLPRPALLARFPRLRETYEPFVDAIKTGSVQSYDEALERAQPRLVSMHTYLAVERAREICLRTLFRRAWVATDRNSRVPLSTFREALELQRVHCDADEVECMVATMIFRGFIRGYISHERQTVVLAKTNAFPSIASVQGTQTR